MAIKKRTDQLPAILSGDVDNNDLMYLVHENAQAETGYDSKKILVSDVGRKLNNGVEYATELPSFPPGDQNPLDALEYLNSKINDLYPVDSASGSLVNFNTSLALPLVALKAYIQAQQESGTPTPSTPKAITGFNSVHINYVDFNQFLSEINSSNYTATNATASYNDKVCTFTATAQNGYVGLTANRPALKKDHKYFCNIDLKSASNTTDIKVRFASGYKDAIVSTTTDWKNFAYIINVISEATNASFNVSDTKASGFVEVSFKNFMFIDLTQAFGSTIADYLYSLGSSGIDLIKKILYKPYYSYTEGGSLVTVASVNNDDYPNAVINLAQTVYGGYIDKGTGKLVITWGSSKISDIAWTRASGAQSPSGYVFRTSSPIAKPRVRYNPNNILCSIFTTDTSDWSVANIDNYNMMIDDAGRIYIRDDDYDNDVTSFVNTLGDTVLYFEIPTPIETDITIPDITALVGEQNIFADTGNIEVSYKMGVQEYIDKKIAETQALIL